MVGAAASEHPSMVARITIDESPPPIASNSDPDHSSSDSDHSNSDSEITNSDHDKMEKCQC